MTVVRESDGIFTSNGSFLDLFLRIQRSSEMVVDSLDNLIMKYSGPTHHRTEKAS
jgi:hypothetical protein